MRTLEQLLAGPSRSVMVGVHDALSARVAEDCGFQCLWGSGLGLSAAMGVRDSNEASWTQVAERLELIAGAVSVPLLADGDTGFGDFNIARRFSRHLEAGGVAGVALEDKLFPKRNSLGRKEPQELASVGEMSGKIRAVVDSRKSRAFSVVARTEAMVNGHGVGAALDRAGEYARAGADAIIAHSASPDPFEVIEFARQWQRAKPLIIIPTAFDRVQLQVYWEAEISMIVWANQLMRAAIHGMRRAATSLLASQSCESLYDSMVPLDEVFRLQRDAELKMDELKYSGNSTQ